MDGYSMDQWWAGRRMFLVVDFISGQPISWLCPHFVLAVGATWLASNGPVPASFLP